MSAAAISPLGAVASTAVGAPARPWVRHLRRTVRVVGGLWVAVLATTLLAVGVALTAGWQLDVVASNSMAPGVEEGSLAVISPVGVRDVRVGDVIAFTHQASRRHTVLHRVTAVLDGEDGSRFETKGDANATMDPLLVPADDVQGRLLWDVPGAGSVSRGLRSPAGYVLLLGVPIVLLAVTEGTRRRDAGAG